jgi:hypothetical protein
MLGDGATVCGRAVDKTQLNFGTRKVKSNSVLNSKPGRGHDWPTGPPMVAVLPLVEGNAVPALTAAAFISPDTHSLPPEPEQKRVSFRRCHLEEGWANAQSDGRSILV